MVRRAIHLFSAASLLLGAAAVWRMQPAATVTMAAVEAVAAPASDADPGTNDAAFAADEPIQPLPRTIALDRTQVVLGQRLFHDPRLSRNGEISCATCHDLTKGGTDHAVRSQGLGGVEGALNSPTVFNSAFNFKQFWDGRADSLEEQVEGPLTNETEMAADWSTVLAMLGSDDAYVAAFAKTYPDGITRDNVKRALGTFQRSLITPDSRFDRFLRGDRTAISAEELEGYQLFKNLGCTSCHQGVNIGGNMFQTMGRMGNYFADRGNVTKADLGRFNVTGKDRDRHKFKVPSLRNVALTAPYLHDGQAATLEDAVRIMAKYQLGHDLADDDAGLLVAFLRTLTGEYREGP